MKWFGKIGIIGCKMLSNNEKERYSRHLLLDDFSEKEQLKLKNAKVLVVGAGGLGSPILLYLVAAGVGTVGIIEDDTVSSSNLQRQILYQDADIGKEKIKIAYQKLQEQNPNCKVITYNKRLTQENANDIIINFDMVVDACDNFATRYVIDEMCYQQKKPYIYGSIEGFKGQVSIFNGLIGKRYIDLFPLPAKEIPFSQPVGVIGALPGVVGSIQAMEAIKIITNMGEPLYNKLLLIDLLNNHFTVIDL